MVLQVERKQMQQGRRDMMQLRTRNWVGALVQIGTFIKNREGQLLSG